MTSMVPAAVRLVGKINPLVDDDLVRVAGVVVASTGGTTIFGHKFGGGDDPSAFLAHCGNCTLTADPGSGGRIELDFSPLHAALLDLDPDVAIDVPIAAPLGLGSVNGTLGMWVRSSDASRMKFVDFTGADMTGELAQGDLIGWNLSYSIAPD